MTKTIWLLCIHPADEQTISCILFSFMGQKVFYNHIRIRLQMIWRRCGSLKPSSMVSPRFFSGYFPHNYISTAVFYTVNNLMVLNNEKMACLWFTLKDISRCTYTSSVYYWHIYMHKHLKKKRVVIFILSFLYRFTFFFISWKDKNVQHSLGVETSVHVLFTSPLLFHCALCALVTWTCRTHTQGHTPWHV